MGLCTKVVPVHALVQPQAAVQPCYQHATKLGISHPSRGAHLQFPPPGPVKILKRIPCAVRHLAAKKFTSIIESVVTNPNSLSAWNRLFRFSSRCLRAPERSGRQWNLTRVINEQIRTESDPPPLIWTPQACRKRTRPGPDGITCITCWI